jgi:hypothetical protein
MSLDSSVSVATDYGVDDRIIGVRYSGGGLGIFLFDTMFRLAMGPTHPPIPMGIGGSLPEGKAAGGVKLTTQPN